MHFQISAPAGFEGLDAPQRMAVDVYYQGRLVGLTPVTVSRGLLSFDKPRELAALVPDVIDEQAVASGLEELLPANEALACGRNPAHAACGHLGTEALGVILDRSRFRLDLFVSPAFERRAFARPDPYIEPPDDAPSLVSAMSLVTSGSSRSDPSFAFQNGLVAAIGAKRVRLDTFLAATGGLQADQAALEIDDRSLRYSAGLIFAPGSDLIGRRKMLGAGFTSQFDTRLAKDAIFGSPLPLALAARAQVEILRNGRLLASQVVEPGNRQLDTQGLPDGAYDVVLRIRESGGTVREERRYFVKSARVAPLGETVLFGYAGMAARETTPRVVALLGHPYFLGGAAHRWGAAFAADATVAGSDRAVVGQLGGTLFFGKAQARVSALASTGGAYGGLVQFGLNSRLVNLSFDLRRVRLPAGETLDGLEPEAFGRTSSLPDAPPALRVAEASFTQLTGFVGVPLGAQQLGVSLALRQQPGADLAFSVGPSARLDLVRRGQMRVSVEGDASITDRGTSAFVGFSVTLAGFRGLATNRAGLRRSGGGRGGDNWRPVASMQGAWAAGEVAGGELALGAGLDRSEDERLVNFSATLRGDTLSANADLVQDLGGLTQYSLGMRSTMAIAGRTFAFTGASEEPAAVQVRIEGGRGSDRFEVLVDEAVVATLPASATRTLPLAPYRQYAVRIRPVGSKALAYDGRTKLVGLYPGSVAALSWRASPLATVIGQLVAPSGEPIRAMPMSAGEARGETDAEGFFQIDAVPGARITAEGADGSTCSASLPAAPLSEDFAVVGKLVCVPALAKPITIAKQGS